MSDVVDKVRKLVALASSPNEEEARTAAVKACRLILEHKLVVGRETVDPRPQTADYRNVADEFRRYAAAQAQAIREEYERRMRANGERDLREELERIARAAGWKGSQEESGPKRSPRRGVSDISVGVLGKAKKNETCSRCGKKFRRGERVERQTDEQERVESLHYPSCRSESAAEEHSSEDEE